MIPMFCDRHCSGASAVRNGRIVVARRARTTHGSSADDSSASLALGQPALHSSFGDRVPLRSCSTAWPITGPRSLTSGTRPMCCLPVSSLQQQSFMPIACCGFSTLYVSIAAAVVAIMVVRGLFGWQQRRFANQLFRQLPDTIQLVTSTVRSGLPVNEAFRTIAREMPQPTAGQFAIVCSELSLGQTSRRGGRSCLSANAGGGVRDVCGDARRPVEVRRQSGRNLADTGRDRESACCAGCSREGSGRRGDLFLARTFVFAPSSSVGCYT